MVSARYIRILSGMGLLIMYLNAAHAEYAPNAASIEEMKVYQSEQASTNTGRSKRIKGNVVRVEYDDFVVKEKNGRGGAHAYQ